MIRLVDSAARHGSEALPAAPAMHMWHHQNACIALKTALRLLSAPVTAAHQTVNPP